MSRIQHQFNRLEKQKEMFLHAISSLSPEEFTRQPAPHKWSVAQIATHLYLSEKLSLDYLRKKLSYPDTVPPYRVRSWGGVALIKLAFWSSWRVKAPATIDMWKDQPVLTADELPIQWEALRTELITFIESRYPEFGSHLAFRHPFAGRLTMRQMLIFMTDHLRHHLKQAHRTIRIVRDSHR